jgi:hypothetical protein
LDPSEFLIAAEVAAKVVADQDAAEGVEDLNAVIALLVRVPVAERTPAKAP